MIGVALVREVEGSPVLNYSSNDSRPVADQRLGSLELVRVSLRFPHWVRFEFNAPGSGR